MKRFQWRPNKEKTWEFAFFNVFPVGPSTLPRPQIYDFDYNIHQEKMIQGAAAILACCGDFGIKIVISTWKDQPDLLFHENHMGEKVLCVKWNHLVPELLAYGSDKGIVRVVQMDKNQEFKLAHTFTMDGKGEPAQVLSLSWDASATYLLASLSSDKVGVIHRKSKARWSVLDPIVISDTPSVRSILICSAERASPFFVLAPSYTSTLELWSRIKEVQPTGEAKVKWQKIFRRDTGVITTMCAFFFQNQDLIATAGSNRTIDVWQILREDRIQTPNRAWGSLGVSCSDGFIYHLKVLRLPKKIKGELSYFTCKEKCKLDQNCGYTTTCLKFDPKKARNQEFLTTGGTHGFIYLWNLHTVPYLLAFEERKRDWEIKYYSISNAPAAEGDGGSIDNTGNVKQDDDLDSIRQDIRDVLIPEYDNMEKSLSDAKDSWAEALNRLKDLLKEPNSTVSELKGTLGDLEQVRKDVEIAAGKAKVAYEGPNSRLQRKGSS